VGYNPEIIEKNISQPLTGRKEGFPRCPVARAIVRQAMGTIRAAQRATERAPGGQQSPQRGAWHGQPAASLRITSLQPSGMRSRRRAARVLWSIHKPTPSPTSRGSGGRAVPSGMVEDSA
jgi:hypothetical protein